MSLCSMESFAVGECLVHLCLQRHSLIPRMSSLVCFDRAASSSTTRNSRKDSSSMRFRFLPAFIMSARVAHRPRGWNKFRKRDRCETLSFSSMPCTTLIATICKKARHCLDRPPSSAPSAIFRTNTCKLFSACRPTCTDSDRNVLYIWPT